MGLLSGSLNPVIISASKQFVSCWGIRLVQQRSFWMGL